MKTKTGTEVSFTNPIRKTYQIETTDQHLAVGIAIDTLKRRYPSLNMSAPEFTVKSYKYFEPELSLADFL